MSAISRGIARLSKRRKKQRELPAIIEQDHTPTELFPQHLETPETNKPSLLGRSMDRLRRSIRQSFRKNRSQERHAPALVSMPDGNGRTEAWQPDEAAVRAGVCSFPVKYLGATEVYESRGMPVCEGALKHLRSLKRQPVKAILYVSGDGLRVVDQENSRGLMVDQTIEKVSFCAPDRNNDRGFAYICRDGTSRRWMCHGFHASKDSGERLSHAVGCAFAICLEKKKKRDEENTFTDKPISAEKALNPDWGDRSVDSSPALAAPTANGTSLQRTNNAYQSFRKKISIGERLQDPQLAIVNEAPSSSVHQILPSIAKPRPAANPALFQRQNFGTVLNSTPIYEGDEENLVSFVPMCSSTPASTSYSTTPSTTNVASGFSGFGDFPLAQASTTNGFNQTISAALAPIQQQPDLMNFNDLLDFNKPISVNTQFSPPPPSVSSTVSRADDWLNQTLKTSLSFNSPSELKNSPSMGSIGNGNNQVYTAVDSPHNESNATASPMIFSSAQGALNNTKNRGPLTSAPPPLPQRPPGVATAISNKQTNQVDTGVTASRSNSNGTDVFGQTVNWEPMSPRNVPKPEDPFDIQWSKMAISANNPFSSEQPRIST